MRKVSPCASGTSSVPLRLKVVSSVLPPEATVPVLVPTLSWMAVMVATAAGGVVSRVMVLTRLSEAVSSPPLAVPPLSCTLVILKMRSPSVGVASALL